MIEVVESESKDLSVEKANIESARFGSYVAVESETRSNVLVEPKI